MPNVIYDSHIRIGPSKCVICQQFEIFAFEYQFMMWMAKWNLNVNQDYLSVCDAFAFKLVKCQIAHCKDLLQIQLWFSS